MKIMNGIPRPLKETQVSFNNDIKNAVSYGCHFITNRQTYCLEKPKRGLRRGREDPFD